MKTTLLILLTLFAVNTFAQDIPHTLLGGHQTVTNVVSVAFSPDGQMLASGSRDDNIGLWDIATGTYIATLRHEGSILSVAFSPDGEVLASGSDDGTIRLCGTSTQALT